MKPRVFADPCSLARAAGAQVAGIIRQAIQERGTARILADAGEAQAELLAALVAEPGLAWGEVELFQLDEYVGLPAEHPASSRTHLFERLIHPVRLGRYHLLDGEHDPERACRDEGEALRAIEIDVAIASLGDRGRVAFNEPPADFGTEKPYLIVRLDDANRRQLAADGAFPSLAEVPDRAITISLRQMLRARAIVLLAPGPERADAVKRCLEGPISPLAPASILRAHANAMLYLDVASAALLAEKPEVEA